MQPGYGPPSGVTAMGQSDPERVRQMMAAFFPRMMADGLRDTVTTVRDNAVYRSRIAHMQQAVRRRRLPSRR
jgi:hypothetical protein